MPKFNFSESPVKKVAETIRDEHAMQVPPTAEQGRAAENLQPVPAVTQQIHSDPIPYNEVLKNVGAKIPYSVYDRLERIKRQSERSGIRSEKRNIGDLVAQAIKEYVEKYDVQ